MRNRYAIALTILGAYFIASYFILHDAIGQQRSMQRAITVSGQQRMYSQRIAMFADAMVARPDSPFRRRALEDLRTSIRIFDGAHRALTHGDPKINPAGWPPPKVRAIYFSRPYDVDRQARDYIAHARALDERANRHEIRADDADLDYLLRVGPGTFLRSLDIVVQAYNEEQHAGLAKFEALQIALLILGLSTLGAIWFTILMPMEREIQRRTAAMELSASLDSLTGLLNRKAFAARVEEAGAHHHGSGYTGALLMIDIDNFKTINDTFGHGVGDDTIVRLADIMRTNARSEEVLGRFGGDEFALFAPAFDSDASLQAFVERLCEALQYDAGSGEGTRRVTASIGVARFPADASSLRLLLGAADSALYASKRSGRARYAFFDRGVSDERAEVWNGMLQGV